MPKDWTTDPAEIPDDGTRHDMTLDAIGFAPNAAPANDNPTKVVVRAVIDNGKYESFKVSTSFAATGPAAPLHQFFKETALYATLKEELAGQLPHDAKAFVLVVDQVASKVFRFSAEVFVEEVEKESERIATYTLGNFDTPQDEASLHLQTEPTQFHRD